jgi:hypothetical protein
MHELIKYIGNYDHDFPKRIEGASPQEIANLRAMTGLELTQDYKAFLKLMGRSTGGVPLINDGTSDIRQILHYYAEMKEEEVSPAPPDCLTIAIAGTLIAEVYLKACETAECDVAWGEDPGNWGIMAQSLRNRLFHSAFLYVNAESPHPRFRHLLRFSRKGKRRRLKAIAKEIACLGLKQLDYSDNYNICAERDDAAVVVQHWENSSCWLVVAASSQHYAADIGNTLAADFDLKPVKPLVKPRSSYLS